MILFLGEDSLSGAGRYVAAILRAARWPFRHRPDQATLPAAWMKRSYRAIVLSDYRYASWTRTSRLWLRRQVTEKGTGLLMVGGWASFTGRVGAYAGTDVENLLPVRCRPGDDRVNRSALLEVRSRLPIIVNGFHRVAVKPGSRVRLSFRDLRWKGASLVVGERSPAWVEGTAGHGRTAAFLTDLAPHWAGGLVDWGAHSVDGMGRDYLKFGARLIRNILPI